MIYISINSWHSCSKMFCFKTPQNILTSRFLRPEPVENWEGVKVCTKSIEFVQKNIFKKGTPRYQTFILKCKITFKILNFTSNSKFLTQTSFSAWWLTPLILSTHTMYLYQNLWLSISTACDVWLQKYIWG